MPRSRASAKAAGARFERTIADHLRDNVSEFIDRRVKTGAKDCGDLANLRTPSGQRLVAEMKDYGGRYLVSEWLNEAEAERVNDGAAAGIVIAKRRGTTDPGQQIVFLTVRDLIAILTEKPVAPLPLASSKAYADSTRHHRGGTVNAETVKVRVRDLIEAQTAAHAIPEDRANFHEVRAVTGTLDRILREAAQLGEPTTDDTVGADL